MNFDLRQGDACAELARLPAQSVHCVVTSPPYWGLRDYGVAGQIGLEATPEDYLERMGAVFAEVWRVLRDDGTLWVNMGDSYAGSWGSQGRQGNSGQMADRSVVVARISRNQVHASQKRQSRTGSIQSVLPIKPKDIMGMPWRLAFALQAAGWYLRADCIWHKPNPMPESVTDRPTKSHEYVFLLSKAPRYFYDAASIAEQSVTNDPRQPYGSLGAWQIDGRPVEKRNGGKVRASVTETRNLRTVWTIATQAFPETHFATFPLALAERCIKAGCPHGGTVLDPFAGACTTAVAALKLGRAFIGIELSAEYCKMGRRRVMNECGLLTLPNG